MTELSIEELKRLASIVAEDPNLPLASIVGVSGDRVSDEQLETGPILQVGWSNEFKADGRIHFLMLTDDGSLGFGKAKFIYSTDVGKSIQVHWPPESSRLFKGHSAKLFYIYYPHNDTERVSPRKPYLMGSPH